MSAADAQWTCTSDVHGSSYGAAVGVTENQSIAGICGPPRSKMAPNLPPAAPPSPHTRLFLRQCSPAAAAYRRHVHRSRSSNIASASASAIGLGFSHSRSRSRLRLSDELRPSEQTEQNQHNEHNEHNEQT